MIYSFKYIEKLVCKVLKLDPLLFHVESKRSDIVRAKQVYSYILKEYGFYSLTDIGKSINRRHNIVIHSHKVISNEIEYNKQLRIKVFNIKSKIFEFDIDFKTSNEIT